MTTCLIDYPDDFLSSYLCYLLLSYLPNNMLVIQLLVLLLHNLPVSDRLREDLRLNIQHKSLKIDMTSNSQSSVCMSFSVKQSVAFTADWNTLEHKVVLMYMYIYFIKTTNIILGKIKHFIIMWEDDRADVQIAIWSFTKDIVNYSKRSRVNWNF